MSYILWNKLPRQKRLEKDVYSFNKYLLSSYNVPGADYPTMNKTILGSGVFEASVVLFLLSLKFWKLHKLSIESRSTAVILVALDFNLSTSPEKIFSILTTSNYLFISGLSMVQIL